MPDARDDSAVEPGRVSVVRDADGARSVDCDDGRWRYIETSRGWCVGRIGRAAILVEDESTARWLAGALNELYDYRQMLCGTHQEVEETANG